MEITSPLRNLSVSFFLLLALTAVAACSREAPPSASETVASPISASQQAAPASTSAPAQESASPSEGDTAASSECQVGQVVRAEEACAYPGTSEKFRVDEAGVGHFLFITANTVIDAKNALINGQPYDFAARMQDDGSWIIEVVGEPADSVRVSELQVATGSSPTAAPAPVAAATQVSALSLASPAPTAAPTTVAPTSQPTPAPTATPMPVPTAQPTPAPITVPTSVPTAQPTPAPPATSTPLPTTSPTQTSEPTPAPADTPTPLPTDTATPLPTPAPVIIGPPQVVAPIPAQTITVGETLEMEVSQALNDHAGDPLGQYDLILSNSSVAQGRVNSVTGELTLNGADVGESWVTLTACNSLGCLTLGDFMFLLTVQPLPNQPPQAARSVADQNVQVGESLVVPVKPAFWDFEGDAIIGYNLFIYDETIASAAVNASDGTITFHGSQVGATTVSVAACDKDACADDDLSLSFTLTVDPLPNRRPEVTGSIADQTIFVGDSISLDTFFLFIDPDGDAIEEYGFSHTDRSVASVSIDEIEGVLTLKGLKSGRTNVAVEASDGELTSVRSDLTFMLTVRMPPGYPPEVIGSIPDQSVELDRSIEIAVSDLFDTPSRYRVIRYDFLVNDKDVSYDNDITRAGVLTLNGSETGKSRVSLRACNSLGCSSFADLEFVLIVSDPDEEDNQKPEAIGFVADRSMKLGETATLDISPAFSDPDDDPIVDYKYYLGRRIVALGSSITANGILRLQAYSRGETTVSVSACDYDDCSDPEDMKFILTVEGAGY